MLRSNFRKLNPYTVALGAALLYFFSFTAADVFLFRKEVNLVSRIAASFVLGTIYFIFQVLVNKRIDYLRK